MMTDQQVQELADRVLRPILHESGFESVDASPKLTDDGDPSLLITVHFKAGEGADTRAAIAARLALWRELQAIGDPRFPHFRYDFRGEDVPSEAEPASE